MEYDLYSNQAFEDNLGKYHYSCDDFELGMYKHPKEVAIQHRYIDPNTKNKINMLVYDIDRPLAAIAWDDAGLAEPNWTCQNPKNGHAHLGYSLAYPISRSVHSLQKPQAYLARIELGYSNALKADPAYSHRLTKNPLNISHRTFYGRRAPYELDELREYLPNNLPLIKHRDQAIGEGRNVLLFTDLRHWAYRARFNFSNLNDWLKCCYQKAKDFNSQFPARLPLSEVKSTSKSVAEWTWKHMSQEKFAEVQSRRSAKATILRQSILMDLTYEMMKDIV